MKVYFLILSLAFAHAEQKDKSASSNCFAKAPTVNKFFGISSQSSYYAARIFCKDATANMELFSRPEKNILVHADWPKFKFILDRQKLSLQTIYKKNLSEIKKLKDPHERIAHAYKLATFYFGQFNFANIQAALSNLQIYGLSADRAALLGLSIWLTNSSAPEIEVFLYTNNLKRIDDAYTWVRIRLRQSAWIFDLDPNLSGLNFVPLMTYEQVNSLQTKVTVECKDLLPCLLHGDSI